MRTFVKTFALPVLAAGLIYILTDQLPMREQYRVPVVLVLTLVALSVAWLIEEKKDPRQGERMRSRILALLAVIVSIGAILLLSHYRNRPQLKEFPEEHTESVPEPPIHVTREELKPATQSEDDLLQSIDATPRARNSGRAWVVTIFSDRGDDFPILRAASQNVLSVHRIDVTSLIRNSAPVRINEELFTATAATLETLRPYCDGLLMARVKVHTVPSDQFIGMYATDLSADMKVVSTSRGVLREFFIEEQGGGFDAGTSQSNAERRLAEKLRAELASFSYE